jgi:hypothetical protein
MEASIIFELFSSYITSHRLVFLKIVSDHMDILDWKSIDAESLIQKKIEIISKIINSYNTKNLSSRIILDNSEINLLKKYSEKFQLTKTQSIQLIFLSENYKKNNGLIIDLDLYFRRTPKSKQERNKFFDKIKKHLST